MEIVVNTNPKTVNFMKCKGSKEFCLDFLARKMCKFEDAGYSFVGAQFVHGAYETLVSNKKPNYFEYVIRVSD